MSTYTQRSTRHTHTHTHMQTQNSKYILKIDEKDKEPVSVPSRSYAREQRLSNLPSQKWKGLLCWPLSVAMVKHCDPN